MTSERPVQLECSVKGGGVKGAWRLGLCRAGWVFILRAVGSLEELSFGEGRQEGVSTFYLYFLKNCSGCNVHSTLQGDRNTSGESSGKLQWPRQKIVDAALQ